MRNIFVLISFAVLMFFSFGCAQLSQNKRELASSSNYQDEASLSDIKAYSCTRTLEGPLPKNKKLVDLINNEVIYHFSAKEAFLKFIKTHDDQNPNFFSYYKYLQENLSV